MFVKEQVFTCEYFVALMGTWAPTSSKLLIISVYAPQELNKRRDLWDYLRIFIDRWEGDTVIMGDFNEVCSKHERFGSTFNMQWAIAFNNFISSACLIDLPLEGYAFTWVHKSDSKMSKLDRYLISEEVDKLIDQGKSNDEILIKQITLLNDLQELNNRNAIEISQKAKIRWSIEGDENSKYFHGIMNKNRSQLAIRRTVANGEWISEPHRVKNDFFTHFKKQFSPIPAPSICFDFTFPTRLSLDQVQDLERTVTYEEVKRAVWDCGTNKSLGPNGFSFEFYRKYWTTIDDDVFQAVRYFFVNGHFPKGSFVANRQILDGPFILNELLSWCKFKKLNGMIFKVDFEKDFDSVKWDYLDETPKAFGFGSQWRNWISSCLNNAMGSVLVNGSPTLEFQFHKGLKQGISLNDYFTISRLFYADDVVIIGEWNNNNIQTLLSVLRCFYLASGLKINLYKNKLMEIGVSSNVVAAAAFLIGCSIFAAPFNYLGVKLKLLSIGDRLSLIKSVLIVIPLYHMSIFKVPIGMLNYLDSIRRNFFYGVDGSDRKLAWIGWNMVLTSKKNGGEVALKVLYKRLYALEMCKSISVAEKMGHPSLSHSFRRMPRGGVEQENYGLLRTKVADLVLPNISDRWCWSLESSQEFSAKSSRILIDNTILSKAEVPTKWLRVVLIKVGARRCTRSGIHMPLKKRLGRKMHSISLKVNVHKSSLYGVGVHSSDIQNMADRYGCLENNLSFTHLGVKVGVNMLRINFWNEVVQNVTSKLSSWEAKTLSVGGRLTLIKSVLGAIPTYYMSLYKVPEGVLSHLESLRNSFFLGADVGERKITWVSWRKVMAYKQLGGLGIIKAIHGNTVRLDCTITTPSGCSVWLGVLKAIAKLKLKGVDLLEFCKKSHMQWCYNLELQKDASVAFKLYNNSDIASTFRRLPRAGIELSQFNELSADLIGCPIFYRGSLGLDSRRSWCFFSEIS
nr:putative RNA-directed DNA polymerase, eukaryota, reverse transcriptase zinc-binding domain protein [Tanacetum cinerariifolium]